MTAALGNTAQGTPFATGVDAFVYPQFIGYAMRAPTTQDVYNPGVRWQDNSVSPASIYQTTGAGIWYLDSSPTGSFTSLTVNGPTTLTGTTNINTTGTAATNIGNATGGTAITGNMTWANALYGPVQTAVAITGASPQIANARVFAVTFTGVTIPAAGSQSFTVTNSTITGATTLIQYTLVGTSPGAALTILSVTNSAGSSVVVVNNGTGASATGVDITLIGHVLN